MYFNPAGILDVTGFLEQGKNMYILDILAKIAIIIIEFS